MKAWYVYRLLDPRTMEPVYVGCSVNPKARLVNHMSDPACAPYHLGRKLKSLGLKFALEVLSVHTDKLEALMAEWRLTVATPGLLNIAKYEPLAISNLR